MSEKQINRTFRNVNKTLAVEGLQITENNRIYGKKFIKGEMSSEDVISIIIKEIIDKKNKLEQ